MNDEQTPQAPYDIGERTAAFADRVIKLSFALPNSPAGWEIAEQVVQAGMSVGANVEEAQGGESTADFLHKTRIARKECREARYFIQRIANAALVPPDRLDELADEADQLLRTLTTIIRNTEDGRSARRQSAEVRNR
jgi:four helix bundle protein